MAAQGAKDFGTSFLHGIMGMFGLGSLYDPSGSLQSDLADAKSKQQTVVNQATILQFQTQEKTNKEFYALIVDSGSALNASIALSDEMIREGLAKTNFFLTAISVVVLMLVLLLMSIKKCC